MADRGWNWHIWELHPETKKPYKYFGFMNDEKSAMEWVKKNGKDHYKVLNFGPTTVPRGGQTVPTRKTVTAPSSKAQAAMAAARKEANRKAREHAQASAEKRRKAEERRAQDAKEMEAIRQDAAVGLEKHKADEKRDLEAGINR